jgi:hypothetical protein
MKPKINCQNLFLPGNAFVWRSMEATGTRRPVESAIALGNVGSAAVLGEGSIPWEVKGVTPQPPQAWWSLLLAAP